MKREGADALQSAQEQFAVGALFRIFDGEDGRIHLNIGIERAEGAFRLVDEGIDAVGIEVGIGKRGGHGADDEPAELMRDVGAAFQGQGDGFQLGDEAVLKIGRLGRLAAAAARRASFVAESLLALVAEHGSFHLDFLLYKNEVVFLKTGNPGCILHAEIRFVKSFPRKTRRICEISSCTRKRNGQKRAGGSGTGSAKPPCRPFSGESSVRLS